MLHAPATLIKAQPNPKPRAFGALPWSKAAVQSVRRHQCCADLGARRGYVRQRATDALITLFARHHVPGRGVMMGCKAWLVTAKA
jgi:hypothetical protein